MGLLSRQMGMPPPMMGAMPSGQAPRHGGPMGMPQRPPQMQQTGQGMPGAFSGNPQFMAQLQQMMARQPMTAPRVGMPTTPPPSGGATPGGGDFASLGMGGAPGMMGAQGIGGWTPIQQPYMDNDAMMGMGNPRFGGFGGPGSI